MWCWWRVCACGVGGGGVCVLCVVKLGTLSLSCCLSFLLSLFLSSLSFLPLLFSFSLLFSVLSPLSLSFSFSFFSCSCSCSFSFSFSSFFPSPLPSSLLPSSLPHPEKKEETFYYRNISGEEFIFYYSFKLIPKNRRWVKLQALQFYINSKTIELQRVKSVIISAEMAVV